MLLYAPVLGVNVRHLTFSFFKFCFPNTRYLTVRGQFSCSQMSEKGFVNFCPFVVIITMLGIVGGKNEDHQTMIMIIRLWPKLVFYTFHRTHPFFTSNQNPNIISKVVAKLASEA